MLIFEVVIQKVASDKVVIDKRLVQDPPYSLLCSDCSDVKKVI